MGMPAEGMGYVYAPATGYAWVATPSASPLSKLHVWFG